MWIAERLSFHPPPNDTMATDPTSGADDFVQRTAQAAHDTIDDLHASAEDMADRISDKARALGDLEYTLLEDVRDCVRDHPLTSVLAAIALGLVVAKLMQPADARR